MRLDLAAPLFLLALLPLVAAAALAYRLSRRHSRRWRTVCLALPLLAATLLILGAAGPTLHFQPAARDIVVLLDLSPSTRTCPWRDPAWVKNFLAARVEPRTRVTLVGFAGQPRPLLPPARLGQISWPTAWPDLPPEPANLAAALAWPADDDRRPRWVITDGLLDPEPLRTPRAFPVAATIIPPERADVGVAGLDVTTDVTTGVSTDENRTRIVARFRATGPLRARGEISRHGRTLAQQEWTFGPAGGIRYLSADDPLPLALSPQAPYEARITAAGEGGGDPWPEDDAAWALAPPVGPPAMLIVTTRPEYWRQFLPASSAAIKTITPAELPTDLLQLGVWQTIVLDETAPADLDPARQNALRQYVETTGGGLLALGSSTAVGPGFFGAGTLADLLPLTSRPPERGPQQIVFLLDGSGSMGEAVSTTRLEKKFVAAAQATLGALAILRPTDEVRVYRFNTRCNLVAAGEAGKVPPELARALAAAEPDGGTAPDCALPVLQRDLAENARVILLTDGEIPAMDAGRWGQVLAAAHARLAIVAPPQTSAVVKTLAAATGAAFLPADTPEAWGVLLRQAVEEQLAGHVRHDLVRWESANGGGDTRAWLEAYVQPGATVQAWTAGERRPLAAVWQRGLGRVAAVAFRDGSGAAGALTGRLLRDVAARAGDRRLGWQAGWNGTNWHISVEGQDASGFLNHAGLKVQVLSPDSPEPTAFDVPQIGPGRYAADLPASITRFTGILTRQDTAGPQLVGRLTPARLPGPEWPATGQVAEWPDGITELPADRRTPWRPRMVGAAFNWQNPLFAGAGVLLLLALFLRRSR